MAMVVGLASTFYENILKDKKVITNDRKDI
jgi:hypothetical protein